MSGHHHHHHERKEMLCLNCGASLYGHYCHACGQENNEPKESVGHLLRHFFEDITHFDGKFFKSIRYIFTKPGFLASEYIKGHRVPYLHPVRLYLLASAIFLLIMSLMTHHETERKVAEARIKYELSDTSHIFGFVFEHADSVDGSITMLHFDRKFSVDGERKYDSIQAALPADKRDEGLDRFVGRRMAASATVYHKAPNAFMEQLSERFVHSFSNVFLISLPLFALLLQLLYARRKDFYFVAHAVFSIHFFCIVFAAILCFLAAAQLISAMQNDIVGYTGVGFIILLPIGTYLYLLLAMKRFYKQSWLSTILKSLLQVSFFGITFLILTIIFYLNSIFKVIETAYQFAL